MELKRFQILLWLSFVAMLAHTYEEYTTKLYSVDPFMVYLSHHFNINPIANYLALQTAVLLLIAALIILSYRSMLNRPLSVILGLVFVIELTHPFISALTSAYYPGLYSGTILAIIGLFYWKELRRMRVIILSKHR